MADGLLPLLARPETWWGPSVLYPLRGAEALAVVASLGVIFWVFFVLVPEYCLTIMLDANSMSAGPLGHLIAIVSALPAVMLSLPALFYWLQYLGRVLVSSAMGETAPPRTPDRNFDGFLNGLSPWLVWLVLGPAVGFAPLAGYGLWLGGNASWNPFVTVALGLFGSSYALMALMMTFLHDDALAAKPIAVLGAVGRVGISFGALCLIVATSLGLIAGAFVLALLLRASHFWLYLAACLGCCLFAQWVSIVVMRVLGVYCHHRRKVLKWHRKRPLWGEAWGL